MVPLSSYQIPRVRQYSGSHLASLTSIHRTVTFFGVASQPSLTCLTSRLYGPKPQKYYYFWFGLLLFRSPLLKESILLFLFLSVLRCFSSRRSPLIHYFTHVYIIALFFAIVFPHSDICGLADICSYPQLFAAYHVLLRLLVPRHSPYALSSLTYFFTVKFLMFTNRFLKNFSVCIFGLIVFILA